MTIDLTEGEQMLLERLLEEVGMAIEARDARKPGELFDLNVPECLELYGLKHKVREARVQV